MEESQAAYRRHQQHVEPILDLLTDAAYEPWFFRECLVEYFETKVEGRKLDEYVSADVLNMRWHHAHRIFLLSEHALRTSIHHFRHALNEYVSTNKSLHEYLDGATSTLATSAWIEDWADWTEHGYFWAYRYLWWVDRTDRSNLKVWWWEDKPKEWCCLEECDC